MTNSEVDKALVRYANGMRNANKKQYASEYYDFMTGGTNIKPIYQGQSIMARQSIEREVNRIIGRRSH